MPNITYLSLQRTYAQQRGASLARKNIQNALNSMFKPAELTGLYMSIQPKGMASGTRYEIVGHLRFEEYIHYQVISHLLLSGVRLTYDPIPFSTRTPRHVQRGTL